MAAEQPKKAVSAYWMWLAENRDEISKGLTSKRGSDVAKAAGEKWKALSAADKEPYEKRAAELKVSCAKEMEDFKSQGGVPAPRKTKAGKEEKKVKDENAPKKPAGGAYGCFLSDKRKEITDSLPQGSKVTDVSKKAGELWKAVSEEEKNKYEAIYKQKSEDYKAALEEYKKNGGQEANDAEEAEEAEEAEKVEDSKAPVKPEPKKRAAKESKDEPAAKRGRKTKETQETKEELTLDSEVCAAAAKLGFETALKNLAGRPEVKASGKSAQELLEALKSSNGLVNPARRALLGA